MSHESVDNRGPAPQRVCLGPVSELAKRELATVEVDGVAYAVTYRDGVFGVIGNSCPHAGGPLGQGKLDGDHVVCPWHDWRWDRHSGQGQGGLARFAVESYSCQVENGALYIDVGKATARQEASLSQTSPYRKPLIREPGPLRVVGISTTSMSIASPRFSGSQHLLDCALQEAAALGCETKLLELHKMNVRPCEGYYSKAAGACIWPCTLTRADKTDEMTVIYQALVYWADFVIVATPIRWGRPSALYSKMVERLNAVQNQLLQDRHLIRNKTASFIIVGGQDNVQAVAGEMLGFFSELGYYFPQFPYIAHSRGWSAEDMEANNAVLANSEALQAAARELARRGIETAKHHASVADAEREASLRAASATTAR